MPMLSRRSLLGNATKGGMALATAGLVGACGSSSPSSSSTATRAPRHGGTLHVGLTGGGSTDSLDPNIVTTNPDAARIAQLYDQLVWLNAAGQPYLKLAEEMTPNKDATVWTIRVRRGVTFHNGKELTAADVIFSINRIVNPKSPGAGAPLFQGLRPSEMKQLDKYTVSVPFTHPYSTLVESLSTLVAVYVVPVGFDERRPVGTGPFEYVSFTPGEESLFKRNANYWDSPLPYVDQLMITDYPDETSQVNALLGGQADAINGLSAESLGTVGSAKRVELSPGGAFTPFTMRVDVAPFTDVRVRQAFRLAVDREKMLGTVFDGHGLVANDIYGIWDAAYDHSIPQRQYDPEQAKALLKAAGHDGLTISLISADVAAGATSMAQVFAQQAAASGINVNIQKVTDTDFYGPSYLKWLFAQDVYAYSPYLPNVALTFLPTSPYNETHFDDPQYNKLYAQALATLDASARVEIQHEMQMIDYARGAYIIPFFPSIFDGYAPTVHGVVASKTGSSFNNWNFAQLWLA